MRHSLTSLILGAVAVSALAAPKTTVCCVMTKNKVDIAEATKAHKYTDYKGKRYYFCCGDCSSMFKKNPGKYAKYGMAIPKAKKS